MQSSHRPTQPAVAEQPFRPYGVLLGTVVSSVAVQGAVTPGRVQEVVVSVLLGASLVLSFRSAG